MIFIPLLISNKFFWISFGHEIGHNFGADHNRESGTVAPYEDAYGHWIQVETWWKHDQIFFELCSVHNLRYSYIANGGRRARRLQNDHGVQRVRPLHQGELVHCSTLSLCWHDWWSSWSSNQVKYVLWTRWTTTATRQSPSPPQIRPPGSMERQTMPGSSPWTGEHKLKHMCRQTKDKDKD